MPIDSVKHSFHIRRKKNDVVFRNIARLWELGRSAHDHQALLDGLHPWNAPINLKFENVLAWFQGCIGLIFLLPVWITPANIWAQLSFILGLVIMAWAYFSYEQDDPIEEVIDFLEQQSIAKKYQLAFDRQPHHISVPFNSIHFIAHLKQLFPVFEQGSVSNKITRYASTVWQDENDQAHQVMLFQYHYVNEIRVRDKNGDEHQVKEIHKDLWGVFVFDINTQGLAVSTSNKKFYYPYSYPWHSSDIQINQRLKFYGSDEMETAKLTTPAFVLRLADFFKNREGDLLFHPESKMLCYIGPHDLFKISSKTNVIQDISALRGHLRTFKLIELENLQRDLLLFLK
ncbi:hypothetical protein D7V64_08350 [Acinetobacter cumulans]|uniref:DUF3137 domain-containing protein n=1 Tax=Acinetobacter cumulans TaxID=2136182 RepID=A0A3A8G1Q4_9GAMM|nr:hypothetical protein [Acinetobacter cumulans]RKG52995.1 hypothetical protein D7V64_08350 [Acinetobacter cumulans]